VYSKLFLQFCHVFGHFDFNYLDKVAQFATPGVVSRPLFS
jgi:hypothetical protein